MNRRSFLLTSVLCAAMAIGPACGGRGVEHGVLVLWSEDARSEDNPFPDERLVDDAGLFAPPEGFAFRFLPDAAITSSADETFARWNGYLREVGGWGVAAPIALRFSAPLPVDALRADAVRFVVPGASDASEHTQPTSIAATVRWVADPGYLLVTPTEPLPAGSRVLVAVRRDLVATAPLARSAGFVARARGAGRADIDLASRALGVAVSEIALVFAYRTALPAEEMRHAFQLLDESIPAFAFHAPVAPADLPDELRHEALDVPDGARVAVGTFAPLDLRPAENDRPGWNVGVWDLAVEPVPHTLEVLYALPDPEAFPPPWPALIIQHGFAGDRSFGLAVGEEYLRRGMAVFSIDASSHGERGSFLGFLRVDDPRVARDHLRETVTDVLQLANLLRSGEIDVDGTPGADLDGRLLFYGHSMGTFIGLPLAALDSRFAALALNAPGASFVTLFQGSRMKAAIALLLRPALGLTIDDPAYDDALPFCAAVIQTLMEPADPLAYAEARARTTPAPILFQMILRDRTLPNGGTLLLTTALGIAATDVAGETPEPRDALWLLDPAVIGFPEDQEDPHGMHSFVPGIHIQAAEFLASGGRELTDPFSE
jgi:hypothetical protein